MTDTGVEPYVKYVSLLYKLAVAAPAALRLFRQNVRSLFLKPDVRAMLSEQTMYIFHYFRAANRIFTFFTVKDRDRNAPCPLS